MRIDVAITKHIDNVLEIKNDLEQAAHEPSGKLSAGFLYQPTRFQLLKYLGVERTKPDAYSLRKFARGKSVEDWFVDHLDTMGVLVSKQRSVEYRGVVGVVDAEVDSKGLQFKDLGIIPHEIKSVTNRNYKYIHDKGDISEHYQLQAAFYALALGTDYYALDFIASDDLREYVTIHETKNMKSKVDRKISQYMKTIEDWKKDQTVPKWEADYKWLENPMYMPFEEVWATCPQSVFIKKLEELGKI